MAYAAGLESPPFFSSRLDGQVTDDESDTMKPNRMNLINIRWPRVTVNDRRITWAPGANWTWALPVGDHGLILFRAQSICDN